jgi:hypothetical protein
VLVAFASAIGTSVKGSAQMIGYSVELDTLFHPDESSEFPELSTYGVYHIYADLTNANDFVSSIFGTDAGNWALTTDGVFYHNALGDDFGDQINPLFFPVEPAMAYDSWWTIGKEPGDMGTPINSAFDVTLTSFADWNSGNDFVVNTFIGGSMFIVPEVEYQGFEVDEVSGDTTLTNPVVIGPSFGMGGDSLKVLVGQITVNESFSFEACAQVFPMGIQANQQQFCPEPIFVEHPYANGECVNDADGDGVCDEFETPGCTDDMACNYNPDATQEDDSCEYADDPYDCDGNCLNDADGDGVCDEFEIPGCTGEAACNFDPLATDDNDSCIFPGDPCDDGLDTTQDDEISANCECLGFSCYDETACNYSTDGLEDNSLCSYVSQFSIAGNESPYSQTLQVYTYGSTEGSTYEWTVVGGDILDGNGSNEISIVWNVGGLGSVCVVETNAEGCSGDEVCLEVNVSLSAISEILDGSLEVFPVPTATDLHLVWTGPTLDNAFVTLRDAQGRMVRAEQVLERDVLDVSSLSAGSYMLEFTVPTRGSIQRRIMIQ